MYSGKRPHNQSPLTPLYFCHKWGLLMWFEVKRYLNYSFACMSTKHLGPAAVSCLSGGSFLQRKLLKLPALNCFFFFLNIRTYKNSPSVRMLYWIGWSWNRQRQRVKYSQPLSFGSPGLCFPNERPDWKSERGGAWEGAAQREET